METDGAKEEIRPPILQLSAEKLNRYGVYLMDYGLVSAIRTYYSYVYS